MIITLECRAACPVCGYLLAAYAFPTVRVNRRSLRQLPGACLRVNPGRCPECGLDAGLRSPAPSTALASPWRIRPESAAEIAAYRARRWPEPAPAQEAGGTVTPCPR